ncbi:hypothetical protein ACGFYE_37290 [Streptomyces zaomyceticus]|uniref:hypothetical protein n=1 Tax=Streptomyces zaomyceticus TaxID=68286 RepID=UPI00371A792C
MTLVPPAPATVPADVVVPPARTGAPGPNPTAADRTDPADPGVREDTAPAGPRDEHPGPEHAHPVPEDAHPDPQDVHPDPSTGQDPERPDPEPEDADPDTEDADPDPGTGQDPEHADPVPEDADPAPAPAPAVHRSRTTPGPRVRPVRVDPPAGGSRGDGADRPPPAPGTPPRFGVVAVPEPSRTAAARRGGVPSVRAVRLTDEPATRPDRPTDRTAAAPAAVTPVPLPVPVPRPATPAVPTPTESRTEEPQP